MARLVLWDIDGTLVRAGALGAAVFDRALALALGRGPSSRILMGGKTDPQIVLEYLRLMEVAQEDVHLPVVLAHLEAELAAVAHLVAEGGTVLPGVAELLPCLGSRPDVLQSVLTGNIAANARVKLSAFGLDRWLDLDVGAYGSDHADRTALVPIALERARRLRRCRFAPDEVWVIGDTRHDLACAQAGGARCLLVATGRAPLEELAGAGADAVAPDLSQVDAIVALLTG